MTDVNKTIELVLELDEKAPPGPWGYVEKSQGPSISEINLTYGKYADAPWDLRDCIKLQVEYRTLCPRLARALKIAISEMPHDLFVYNSPPNVEWRHEHDCKGCEALSQIAKVFE
jgi:hypothetical protein